MNCQQAQDAFGDQSVGLLDAQAEAALAAHISGCAACALQRRAFHRCLELLNHTPSPEPPAGLWLGVRARLDLERSLAELATVAPARPASPPWWNNAAAAVSGFAAAMGLLYVLSNAPGGTSLSATSISPAAVTISRHGLMDGSSSVTDSASVVAADAANLRFAPGGATALRVILPGPELLGEPVSPVEKGAVRSWPSASVPMEDARR